MEKRWAILVGLIFFIAGLLTLPHYGINWDAINHLPRGQAYLNFFLTGKKDFSNFSEFEWYWQDPTTLAFAPDRAVPRVSLYQATGLDFNYFVENDGGHPPVSDILSSVFNLVFFQKLGLVNDIDSYRIYGALLSAILVGVIFWWVGQVYGKFAGFIAALSLAAYPLFLAESHFNTEKDIPETVFWGLLLFAIWLGVKKVSWRWIIFAGLIFGLALGTKFNVVFAPLAILPWFFFVAPKNGWLKKPLRFVREHKKFTLTLLVAPVLGVWLFFALWPYLWADPLGRLLGVLKFYKQIGLTQNVDPRFTLFFAINSYPSQWIFYTTPLVTLLLSVIGFVIAARNIKKEKHGFSLLVLLWFLLPIARVSLPGTTIYGGIRQIMEYIPAMAILAGVGAGWLLNHFRRKRLVSLLILLPFAFLVFNLYKIHPNENVYFNEIIGGLAGARSRNLPAWGNSFGAAYRQGVSWLNQNAEPGARLAYARELIPNIPRIWLRQDMVLHNSNRSGYLRAGEYVIALTYEGTESTSYFDRYLERFLEPVYEVSVDEVPVLKVWKNDNEHTRKEFLKEQSITKFTTLSDGAGLRLDLGSPVYLTRLEGDFPRGGCPSLSRGYVQISEDGENWERLPGTMPGEDWSVPKFGNQPAEGYVLIPFAGDLARFIKLVLDPPNSCLGKLNNIRIFALE